MYSQVDPKVKFSALEVEILEFWSKNHVFERSVENRAGSDEYVFYDGPPFATGLPHFGTFVPGIIKDVIPRYQTMKGKQVERRFGWDCHGLPVEYEMEKELGISGRREIEEFGVAKFNEACRSIVLRYSREWESIITRLGRWVDFENDYKTMDLDYMETIWWVFRRLWDLDLIYEGYYILPYCPRCSTVLSNHELSLGGYHDVNDPAITVKFRLREEADTFFLAWTTTPWTLTSNLSLVLGPDIDYVKLRDNGEFYILARDRVSHYYDSEADYEIVATYRGSELSGISFEPLMPYFAALEEKGAFRTLNADFVTTENGTGIVHIAPGFGEDDHNAVRDTDIPIVCPIDAECKFTDEVGDFQGRFVKDVDKEIIERLRSEGALFRRDTINHSYPHCWRCNTGLIYRAISSWFVNVQKVKVKMVGANQTVSWIPEHLRDGRFGKWLENARDWAISRNRFWGNPIPIWRCDSCGDRLCIGSREELARRSGEHPDDLHKHFVDSIKIPCACGGTKWRVPEVLDCWFESGAMPYGQNHYPFENKRWFEEHFPSDFIAEGVDQTRGWFYTLTILATALFDGPAFKHVVVNGIVLAGDGKKMSKSAKNYPDPVSVIDEFGADALRLFLMSSAVVRAEDLRYTDDGVREVLKATIIPLWNAYSFFVTYANIDDVSPDPPPQQPDNPLDQWILSESQALVSDVTRALDANDLQRAVEPIREFLDLLNNWYIRRSRRRYWRSGNDVDKRQAYQSLYAVLMTLVHVSAPFIPFVTEAIYRNLRRADMPDSVHLADYPVADKKRRDHDLEFKMEVTRRTVSLGRSLRSIHSIKTRQPLRSIHLVTRDTRERAVLREMEDIIRDELNVKEVIFRDNEEELVSYSAKANFKILGRRLGKDMKAAAARIASMSTDDIQSLLDGATLSIDIGSRIFDLDAQGVLVERNEKADLKVINEGSLTVALDPEITAELYQEGIVRDIVRSVQNLRKQRDLHVTDRIILSVFGSDTVREAVEGFESHLLDETLTTTWHWRRESDAIETESGNEQSYIAIAKA